MPEGEIPVAAEFKFRYFQAESAAAVRDGYLFVLGEAGGARRCGQGKSAGRALCHRGAAQGRGPRRQHHQPRCRGRCRAARLEENGDAHEKRRPGPEVGEDRKSTRLNSSHVKISYAVFCLKKKINSHILKTF